MDVFSLDNPPPRKEVLSEIMSRLEPSLLMRFKCLNKSWCRVVASLIKDPEFVSKHLGHANASPPTILVFEPWHEHRLNSSAILRKLVALFLTKTGGGGGDNKTDISTKYINLPCNSIQRLSSPLEVHHCNGVLCFIRGLSDINLYNLTLRDFHSCRPKSNGSANSFELLCTGFGSDLRGLNYKVIALCKTTPLTAQIYAPGSDSDSWREIEFSSSKAISWQKKMENHLYLKRNWFSNHVYLKGNCFWLMQDLEKSWKVLRFDVHRETFRFISFPDIFITESMLLTCTVLDGTLRFMLFPSPKGLRFDRTVTMCTMNFYSVGGDRDGARGYSHSWRHFQRIELFSGFSYPMTFVKSDELVLDTTRDHILCFNLRTGMFYGVPVPMKKGSDMLYTGPYVKSLVSFQAQKQA